VRHADLAAVRLRVGEIRVIPPPGAARLLVDGREVSAGRPAFVKPGQHEVTVAGREGQVARAHVTLAPGESQSVPLSFESRPAAAGAPAPPPVVPAPAGSALKPWIVGAGVTTAVVLFVTGLELHIAASASYREAEAKTKSLADAKMCTCAPEFLQRHEDVTATNARASALESFGWTALVAGGLAGAATLVYVVLPDGSRIQARAGGAAVTVRW
jgi:hypothetical protein